MTRGKIGLALGGGVARGWSHIGVIRTLAQAGIKPDIIAGTSMGAVVGGCYAAGQLDQLEGFARELTRRKVFGFLDFNMTGSGLINGQRLGQQLEAHLADTEIEKLGRRFAAVATEIGTGHEIWLTRGRLVDAMRASYALPGIFRPVQIAGRWLFDGAIVNPIPVAVCRALGARYVIAVNVNSDTCGRGTVVGAHELMADGGDQLDDAAPETRGSGGARKLLQRQLLGDGRDAPGISTVMAEAFNIVQDRIARSRLAGDPPDCMITPRLAGIGLFDFHRADELIQRGMQAAEREVEDIHRELSTRRAASTPLPALEFVD